MHPAGKIFVKTYLKAIRDTFFPNMWNFPICDIFIQQKGTLPLPSLVGYPYFPMIKTLRVVGLLTVMIFFKSKTFTACKIKDEKEETIF